VAGPDEIRSARYLDQLEHFEAWSLDEHGSDVAKPVGACENLHAFGMQLRHPRVKVCHTQRKVIDELSARAHERTIALVLVDAIDDRGFLSLDVEEIATETGTSQEDIEKVLHTIQEIAPPGVGARSLQESLLLQVDYLRAEGVDVPDVVKRVIEDHLEELGSKRIARIARALGASDAPAALFDLARSLGAEMRLAAFGLGAADLDRAAELAAQSPYPNPAPVTREGVRALLQDAYDGRRPAG